MRKQTIALLLCTLLLAGCGREQTPPAPTESIPGETAAFPVSTPAPETQPPAEAVVPAEPGDSELVLVKAYIPDILAELKYASADNFTGKAVYDFSDVYLRYGTVKKLMAVQKELAQQGLRLKIWDGFRPLSAQRALWEVCPDPNYVSHPDTGSRNHCRGNAVDLTVTDMHGMELKMPTAFDDFSALADRDYSDCGEEAAANAEFFQSVMEEHGFSGYFKEWWHYADTQDYPVETVFDPAVISLWYADCQEFITLRHAPDTGAEAITRIPAGEELTLLGYDGDFALVEYEGLRGYVLSSYLSPAESYAEVEQREEIFLNQPTYRAVCQHYISLRVLPDGNAGVITHIPDGDTVILLEWKGDFALVDYNGLLGYVAAGYIEPT